MVNTAYANKSPKSPTEEENKELSKNQNGAVVE